MTTTGIRKVTMPRGVVAGIKDMAWRRRVSASQIVREIIEEFTQDPDAFRALPDMEGALDGTLTVYVPEGPWYAARDVAYLGGRTPISVVIRKGLRARLERVVIPAEA